MADPVSQLLETLAIERLELNLFRGLGGGGETTQRIYGGQVIAQALAAAYHTVEDRPCHSLHAYFIRPGDPKIPVIYEVDRARDGGSFTTRRVIAVQHGRQIFNLAASFHKVEPGFEHQHPMPEGPGPEGLRSRAERQREMAPRAPEKWRREMLRDRPIEIRELDPVDLLDPQAKPDANQLWFRVAREIDEAPWVHHCLMAYASDMNLLSSGVRPHGVSWMLGQVMTASLDHAMWFHAPTRFDRWHFYSMDAPFSGGGRGFNRGGIYAEDGTLVASVAQEGLMRPMKREAD